MEKIFLFCVRPDKRLRGPYETQMDLKKKKVELRLESRLDPNSRLKNLIPNLDLKLELDTKEDWKTGFLDWKLKRLLKGGLRK